ncbi:alkene reductase [Duganella aceris]|uniref:Alkene reductase n=1 Tax=Duganella aceris TaxID=2703883 RepID=A0ABX0FKV9_9BURK|nr:alkene reductase [Duganella aceris]NGZ85191.1 alkene reductase [Duganella aceris]
MTTLFSPFKLGRYTLPNRIVMAPMTRARAIDLRPNLDTAIYYQQRASAGLIISEGVPISEEGRGQAYTPGIYNPAQVEAWRKVTRAVHERGGRMFAQLWHVGRASHTSQQVGGLAPVGASDLKGENVYTWVVGDDGVAGMVPQSQPRQLATEEVARVTSDFVHAARCALEAEFDGIELHGANGYLFEQFINASVNNRSDRYGGSIANRLRFTLETVDAVAAAIGADRVGIRLAPFGRFNDMRPFEQERETWLALASELSKRNLAYVHLSDQETLGEQGIPQGFVAEFRAAYAGTLILAGGYDKQRGVAALDADKADLIAIGRAFIANPDLVERMRHDWPLAEPDRATFYGLGNHGYTDYPAYQLTPQA